MFALLVIAFPAVWFLSSDAADWVARALFWLFVLGAALGMQPIRRDPVVQLCAMLILVVVVGYVWQRFTVPEELLGGSSAKKYIPAFCFFVVVAYGVATTPRVSPLSLLICAGMGLLAHLSWAVPADDWVAGWRGERVDFEFWNAQHAGIVLATALLAAVTFLPRAVLSCSPRGRMLIVPLLSAFILLMIFGVIATQARATWLGLMFSVTVLLLFGVVALFARCHALDRRVLAGVVSTGMAIVLAGAMALYAGAGSVIAKRLSVETVNIETIKETARLETVPRSSASIRIGAWSAASEWIAERPVFGWGGRAAAKLIEQSPYFDERFTVRHLHNSYLETLLNVGGAAMACMIAIVLLVAWRTFKGWRQGRIPADVFLFACAFYPFWATVNMFESYITYDSGFLINALIGGFVYSWYLRGEPARDARHGAGTAEIS